MSLGFVAKIQGFLRIHKIAVENPMCIALNFEPCMETLILLF